MEEKLVRVPFDIELAKKIQDGEVEGKIYDAFYNCPARIVDFNFQTMFGKLNIVISERIKEGEVFCACNDKGVIFLRKENKFDDEPTFFLEIPEYMTFKDGDVLTYRPNRDRWCIFIYKGNDIGLMHNYVTYDCDSRGNNILTFGKSSYISTLCELSTEFEKQKLIDALKESKDSRAKEYLKRFFNIEFDKGYSNVSKIGIVCKFKPFDKVLVRESNDFPWRIDLFSHIQDGPKPYVCLYHYWKYCIPYEGNEHLLGTTDNE